MFVYIFINMYVYAYMFTVYMYSVAFPLVYYLGTRHSRETGSHEADMAIANLDYIS